MILFYIIVFFSAVPNHPWVEQPVAGLTVIKYLGIFCMGYALVHVLSKGEMPPFFQTWQARLFMLLFAIAGLSFFFKSSARSLLSSPMLLYVSFFLAFFVTVALVDSIQKYRMTLLCSVGAIAFASLYVLREWQKSGYSETRPGYVAGDSNYFALCALLVMPMMFFFLRIPGPRWQKWLCLGSLVVTLPAFTLASSRGGFVGLCVAFVYSLTRSQRWKQHLLISLVVLLPLMLFAPSSPIKRFLNPGTGDIEAVQIRKAFWDVGWNMFRQNPFTGVGIGEFALALDDYGGQDLEARGMACNTYLEYAAELGVFAVVAYLGILAFGMITMERQRRYAHRLRDPFLHYSALGIQVGLLGYATAGIFVSAEYQKLFWLYISITCCIPRLLKRVSAQSREQSGVIEFAPASGRLSPVGAGGNRFWD